jgi:hypothetical protein
MKTTHAEDDTNALMDTDLEHMKSYPKMKYVRNKNLLRLVASLPCQRCGFHLSQAAHSNWHGGKGRGIKASDNYIASLCQSCHHKIDQGTELTREERIEEWVSAHIKTLHILTVSDQWPHNVPLTDLYLTFTQGRYSSTRL